MRHLPRALAVATLLCATGCYSTTSVLGDGGVDGTEDGAVDTGVDTGWDGGVDTWADTAPDSWWDVPSDPPLDIGPDGTPSCPPRTDTELYFELEGEGWEAAWIDERCVIEHVDWVDEADTFIHMMCPGSDGIPRDRILYVHAWPPAWIPAWEGEEVRLRYESDPVWWVNRWFAIHWSWGGLVVAGTDAELPHPFASPPDDWYAPIDLWSEDLGCAPEYEGCGMRVREAIGMDDGYGTTTVLDGSTSYAGPWGGYQLSVAAAHRYEELWCEDVPWSWYLFLVTSVLDG